MSVFRRGIMMARQATPIQYLTQWKIVGNSEVHGQEIWSCGEYSEVDGKWHILVQPQGGSIADIALTEPLRKVNNVADTIEFPSETEGKALVTRRFNTPDWENDEITKSSSSVVYFTVSVKDIKLSNNNILSAIYPTYGYSTSVSKFNGLGVGGHGANTILRIVNDAMSDMTTEQFREANAEVEILYEIATPTTELVDAPQIEEAESYTCVISQGGKAVSWSSFTTE